DLILPIEIYGSALLLLSGLSWVHLRYLYRHPQLATPDLTPESFKLLKLRIGMFTLIPALSMVLALVSTRVALYVYLLLAMVHFLPARIDERIYVDPEVGESLDEDPH